MPWYAKARRTCSDCPKTFIGGPAARYCPQCRWEHPGRPAQKYIWTPERDAILLERYRSQGRRRGTRRQSTSERRGGSHGPGDPWVFNDEDLVRFIQENPLEFRLDKVDQLWFMDLITAGGLMRRALQAARGAA